MQNLNTQIKGQGFFFLLERSILGENLNLKI